MSSEYIIAVILVAMLYLGGMALSLWIFYLILKHAVYKGVSKALDVNQTQMMIKKNI